jgi:glycosyltransferase involved in cell wall biosynthesis
MGREGRRRVIEQYNWQQESQRLLDLYSELL